VWPSCARNWDSRDPSRAVHAALLADIRAADRFDRGFRLWWLGQSGFLLQWQGVHVLLDPYLSDSLTRKYRQTDKPHVRMTELVIDPAQLSFVDIATSSHNHTDHLDAETLGPILARNPSLKLVDPGSQPRFRRGPSEDRSRCADRT
jgi:L-ascorbate metabolism protein UlaG (beta-lactamase superfamily)